MSRFNNWLAEHITKVVGTMYCFYLFNVIAFLSAKAAFDTHNPTIIVQWVSSNWLQLILLPAIMVGQNLQSKKHSETLKAVKDIHKHLGITKS
jgi:succinate dehydrogenase hydrophobic anchor subunit